MANISSVIAAQGVKTTPIRSYLPNTFLKSKIPRTPLDDSAKFYPHSNFLMSKEKNNMYVWKLNAWFIMVSALIAPVYITEGISRL